MKTLVSLLVVISSVAFAQPPREVGAHLRYSDLLPIFKAGGQTSEQMLKGNWALVSIVTNHECNTAADDIEDPNGLKNRDGSPFCSLHFSNMTENHFGSPQSVFAIQITGIGFAKQTDANQGPYIVDPQQPQFSTFSYSATTFKKGLSQKEIEICSKATTYSPTCFDGGEKLANYWEASCRALPGRVDGLICGQHAVFANGDKDECSQSAVGIVSVYKKVP